MAHTANDSIDVIDCTQDRFVESIAGFPAVAGALVSEARGLVFATNRGENTVSVFTPGDEPNGFKIGVGVKPNGVAFDDSRGLLVVANVGDPAIADSYTASVVDVGRRERIAEIKVPGRTRWAIFDPAAQTFFINIASPARIVAIDAREPDKISKQYEMPAAGPHGLDLDPATGRLFCACDAGILLAIDVVSGGVDRRSWRHRCHRRCHDAPEGSRDDGIGCAHASARSEKKQSLCVSAPLASCRSVR